MRNSILVAVLFVLVGCSSKVETPEPQKLAPSPTYSIHFSGCVDAIVKEISKAKKTILVQAYYITHAKIVKALVDAKDRGVNVQVICDKGVTKNKTQKEILKRFHDAGISVLVDGVHQIAHNKVMIIDDEVVITGSFNFTNAAESHNAENLVIVINSDWAEMYSANWHKHKAHSEVFVP